MLLARIVSAANVIDKRIFASAWTHNVAGRASNLQDNPKVYAGTIACSINPMIRARAAPFIITDARIDNDIALGRAAANDSMVTVDG